MTKAEIVNQTAGDTGVDQQVTSKVIERFLSNLKNAAFNGEPVFIRGFGTFNVIIRAAKTARNITKGLPMAIPEKKVVKFKASSEYQVNQI